MLRRILCWLVALSLCATSLPADDAISPPGDGLSAAVQEYLQLAADDEWGQAVALLEKLAEQHPDHPAVQLMREHAQLRSQASSAATPEDAASWEALCELRLRAKGGEPEGQRIQAALEQRIDVDFDDVALSDVMGHIATTQGINVVLDEVGLTEVGLTSKSLINLRVNDVRLSTVLDLLLEPLNLGYVVQDEVLKITSRERLAGPMITRVYSVSDLVQARRHVDGNAAEELERLSLLLQETIDPNGWSNFGGRGYCQAHEGTVALVIRQTAAVHQEIADLLEGMRRKLEARASHSVWLLEVLDSTCEELGLTEIDVPVVVDARSREAWLRGLDIPGLMTAPGIPHSRYIVTADRALGSRHQVGSSIYSVMVSSRISDDRRKIRLRVSVADSFDAEDVLASVQTANVPDGGLTAFVVHKGGRDNRSLGRNCICIIASDILVNEEEEELLRLPIP